MKNILNYRWFHFGPLLIRTKIKQPDLLKVKKLISKKGSNYNKRLAGVIKNEHAVDRAKYQAAIAPYLNLYLHGHEQRTGHRRKGKWTCTNAWVNYMKPGEFNPPHTHDACNISSVLFVKIPDELKKENEIWRKKEIRSSGPGSLEFMYMLQEEFCIGNIHMFPEEGELYIFPNFLFHFVAPFTSKCERVSVAANFDLKTENP